MANNSSQSLAAPKESIKQPFTKVIDTKWPEFADRDVICFDEPNTPEKDNGGLFANGQLVISGKGEAIITRDTTFKPIEELFGSAASGTVQALETAGNIISQALPETGGALKELGEMVIGKQEVVKQDKKEDPNLKAIKEANIVRGIMNNTEQSTNQRRDERIFKLALGMIGRDSLSEEDKKKLGLNESLNKEQADTVAHFSALVNKDSELAKARERAAKQQQLQAPKGKGPGGIPGQTGLENIQQDKAAEGGQLSSTGGGGVG